MPQSEAPIASLPSPPKAFWKASPRVRHVYSHHMEHVYYLGPSSTGPTLDANLLGFLTLQAVYAIMECPRGDSFFSPSHVGLSLLYLYVRTS